jgi:DNA modification methylase
MQEINKLILGDNLEILRNIETETVDLIYLDPPFFSNRNYEVIWGDKGEVRSFEDRFSGGIDHYISWLKERVIEMHRILKPTGNIFLHCDWHADAYIRVQILDKIFGEKHFRNNIIWKRTSAGKPIFNNLPKNADNIFWFSKTDKYSFNRVTTSLSEEDKSTFTLNDNDGRGFYNTQPIINPGIRPNLQYTYKTNEGKDYASPKNGWRFNENRMKELENDNRLFFTDKIIREKYYLSERELKGKQTSNVWDDIQNVQSDKEKIGYPTQKPEKLLARIIEMSSNENDLILDPFVGGGTTISVADKLNRNWIGIDQSVAAIKVTEMRMQNNQSLFSKPFVTQLHKYDYDTLRYKDAFEFEIFIVTQFGGINNTKQRGDLGLDGKTRENTPIQVKRSDNIGRNVIDNFKSACERNDKNLYEKNKTEMKPTGFIIAFSFGKGAVQEVARLHNEENIIIKLVTVEEIIPIAKKPTITVNISDKGSDSKALREIDFVASATSENGIEFYAWDFDYKNNKFNPQILIDKIGTQTHKFKAGLHNIAVKVVDSEGLESIEIIKLKVNGKIERT